jgi:hypothetical protein
MKPFLHKHKKEIQNLYIEVPPKNHCVFHLLCDKLITKFEIKIKIIYIYIYIYIVK